MAKKDLKKELKHLYFPSTKECVFVDVPEMNFLMLDGEGDPNTAQEYKVAIEALYSVSYTVKFMVKKKKPAQDYVVMPLEGLWWSNNMKDFLVGNKDAWKWTAMIVQPSQVTKTLIKEAIEQVKEKKNPPALPKLRFESFQEGLSAQIMHIGHYSAEGPTIEKLHKFIRNNDCEFDGLIEKHHEIYLSDPRRTPEEKWKTVIRQPVKSK
ncbi:GyrI-like domain-containing protein [Candidatus Borrarchaeum sp.]|uniref:GyrI-like domain-containing protein n=1 Tax=Candidatus Borrarchaeum sp. TaxID=2846742 RepID=UPI00257EED19|nr:GyrI-like domain-containing protein [Candidatus Borrarchaeum sp.]